MQRSLAPSLHAVRALAWSIPLAFLVGGVSAYVAAPFAGIVSISQTKGVLSSYTLDRQAPAVRLPRTLAEVSGLAITADGRVFAHDDERAVLSQVDPGSGRIVKSFHLGGRAGRGDFEGIEVVGDRFFLTTSGGTLYEFHEAADGAEARYRAVDTGLGRRCEIEGLAHDARAGRLLLACKTTSGKALDGRLVVFAVRLSDLALEANPGFAIPLSFLDHAGYGRELHPSGIAVHPKSGTLFVIAARERLILELSPRGAVLGVRELPKGHPQPEGIAFLADGTMLIADERRGGGLLTRYPMTDQRRSMQ